ncbi:MAG: hypothetical protein IKN59_02810 [Paludibacteraceae bacterium]|nr:hypothetical protein [Paludibacteraceae bacterium]
MKKTYNTIQISVVHLRAHDIIVTSPDGIKMMGITPNSTDVASINDDNYDERDYVW